MILTFAACMPAAKKASQMNGHYAQAISLCQHKIDNMRAVGFGQLTYANLLAAHIIGPSPTVPPYSFHSDDSISSYLIAPTATINVENTTNVNVKKVTVTITWKTTNHESKTSSMKLRALISNAE